MKKAARPRIIMLVGPDGSGKSTLARMAAEELEKRGIKVKITWSRFNNFLSKPLLALARITRHSYYEMHDGVRFGYHDFERNRLYRGLFPILQAVDANRAARSRLREGRGADVVIFERGPWDTLADVILDTGRAGLADSSIGRWMTGAVQEGMVLAVLRSRESILETRPELKHDRKLEEKLAIYESLAAAHGWTRIDNDRPLDEVRGSLVPEMVLACEGS